MKYPVYTSSVANSKKEVSHLTATENDSLIYIN
jgi:hypothetical protein